MREGFTLIELIVVIAIIAILAAVVAPNAFKAVEKAKISKALADWNAFKSASAAYYADTGQWPGRWNLWTRIGETGLTNNTFSLANWDGPYLEKESAHPWGGMYWLSRNADYNNNGIRDLDVEMGEECWVPLGGTVNAWRCFVPQNTAEKMDRQLDDGNLTTGNVRYFSFIDFRRLLISDTE
ncbi:MAG: type II secretion system protein GspG [Candidatus Omnitrophica bacterium]|nr:type II secretion system protein GspG [Candidatus Omnitrophota bacterium]